MPLEVPSTKIIFKNGQVINLLPTAQVAKFIRLLIAIG